MSKDLRAGISSALHRIRTRALRDAPVYLQHVSSAEQELNQLVSGLFTQQQVEQMMNELVGDDLPPDVSTDSGIGYSKTQFTINMGKSGQRQSIPSIIKKYGGK